MAALLRITKYVLTVHEPTIWNFDNYEATGRFSFESPSAWVESCDPFPIPRLGEEIQLEFGSELPTEAKFTKKTAKPNDRRIVSRVCHHIQILPGGLVYNVDVYTDTGPALPGPPFPPNRSAAGG